MYKITIAQENPTAEGSNYAGSTELYVQRVEHIDIPAITALVNTPQNLQFNGVAMFRTTPDECETNTGFSATNKKYQPADEEHDSIEAHRVIHAQLHRSLEELVTDFTAHNSLLLADTPIITLVKWSFEQTKNPTPRT